MDKLLNYLPVITALVGGWAIINGILHDIFILAKHNRGYDRDLLRLLMDGHILITCGIFLVLSYRGLTNGQTWGYCIAGAACISLLVYCGMIFPFLKSFGMIFLNAALLSLLIVSYLRTH